MENEKASRLVGLATLRFYFRITEGVNSDAAPADRVNFP